MFIPECIQKLLPEFNLPRADLPRDSDGEVFLPLDEETKAPLPFDRVRPGYYVMAHMTVGSESSQDKLPLSTQLDAFSREGYIAPPAYATFTVSPYDHADRSGWTGPSAFVVAKTPFRITRESSVVYYHDLVEPMIGVSKELAREIVPTGVRHWEAQKVKMPGLKNNTLRYIPPKHIQGVIYFGDVTEREQFFGEARKRVISYKQGECSETDVAECLVSLRLAYQEPEMLLISIAAMFTQDALLDVLTAYAIKQVPFSVVQAIKPDYPWTKQVHEEILDQVS